MTVYGVMVNNEWVLLTDGTSGKPVLFAEEPTNLPVGMVAKMRWQELTDRIQQVYDVVTATGSAADAAVQLAKIQAESLSDDDALKVPALYDEWSGDGVKYKKDKRLNYNGDLYKVLKNHTSQYDWTPDTAHSLFVKIDPVTDADPDAITEWVEKQNGIDEGYKKDQVVTLDGKYYKSKQNNNFYKPGPDTWAAWEDVTSQYVS